MQYKNFRAEIFSKNEIEKYKGYSNYEELRRHEFPTDHEEYEEEKAQRAILYKIKSTSKRIRKISPAYIELERMYINDRLNECLDTLLFYQNLEKFIQEENIHALINEIQQAREKVFSDPLLDKKKITFVQDNEAYDNSFKEIQKQRENYVVAPPQYQADHVKVQKLYHWIPKNLLPSVLKQGLLPGFLHTGYEKRQFVYTSLDRNEFWKYQVRGNDKDVEFVELEIKYDETLPAYMWMGYYLEYSNTKKYSASKYDVLSNKFIPLSAQASELIESDKYYKPSKWDRNYYSTLQQKQIPNNTFSSVTNWEYSEVLLDYVPPNRIRIIH